MAWLFAPGSAGSNSGCAWPWAPGIAPFVTSSGKGSPRRRSWPGWKTRPWVRRLSGTTCGPSTLARGVESWISSLRESRANRFPQPANDDISTTTGGCGATSLESSPSARPASSSSRTCRGSCVTDCATCGAIFGQWVTEWRRDSSRRQKSARRTDGNGSSFWPTPTEADCRHSGSRNTARSKAHTGTSLSDLVLTGNSHGRAGRTGVSPMVLNPRFVEHLMGVPIGWTSGSQLSETEWSRWWRLMRSELSRLGW